MRLPFVLLILVLGLLLWSGIHPYDYLTWLLEVAPAVIGLIILVILYPKFQFSHFTLCFIALEMAILIIGGHYTYALNPTFEHLKDLFDWQRNYYDRLGHLTQGLVPALISREIILRKSIVKKGPWLFWIVLSICLAISATYEILEFMTAFALGEAANDFLGTQGDLWDTQWDMLLALIGSITGLICFSKAQDRNIKNL